MTTAFLTQLGAVVLFHLVGVAAPGPDFAIVLQQSIHHGRHTAICTSLGIATGILFHVSYSLFGLSWVLERYPHALEIMRYAGAAYLAWMGAHSLHAGIKIRVKRAASANKSEPAGKPDNELFAVPPEDCAPLGAAPSRSRAAVARTAYLRGLGVNVLNPKVALFFIATFTVVVAPETPLLHKAIYGTWMVGATAVWFTCVSCFFTTGKIRSAFLQRVYWLDCIMGVLLLFVAASLLVARLGVVQK